MQYILTEAEYEELEKRAETILKKELKGMKPAKRVDFVLYLMD